MTKEVLAKRFLFANALPSGLRVTARFLCYGVAPDEIIRRLEITQEEFNRRVKDIQQAYDDAGFAVQS